MAAGNRPILVVDDDPDHRASVRELLEHGNFPLVEASNGREALDYLLGSDLAPCLILLDLSMPVMDGWELLAIIKSYVRLAAIPVVLISSEEPRLDPVRHGTIVAYLPKPYNIDRILDLCRRYGDDCTPADG